MTSRVAVYGAGSWGTAFSLVLADAGREVTLWGRHPGLVDVINGTGVNADYLPGVQLPERVRATADPAEAAREADIVVLAVSAQYARPLLEEWRELWTPRTVFVSLMKGVELGTNRLMSEVIAETTGAGPDRIAVLSGPNLAREIVQRKPAASVVACADEDTAVLVQASSVGGWPGRTPRRGPQPRRRRDGRTAPGSGRRRAGSGPTASAWMSRFPHRVSTHCA